MANYLFRRLLTVIPVFFGITVLVFLLMSAAPGSVADLIGAGGEAVQAGDRETVVQAFGLDHSLPVRYLRWLGGLLRGDLGISFRSGRAVNELIGQRLIPSLVLTGSGVLLAVTLAVPLGVLAAWKPRSRLDRTVSGLAISASAIPGFFLALLCIYVFSILLGWLPSVSLPGQSRGLLLPAAVIGVSNIGGIFKQTRSAILEVLGEDYITTARAKGVGELAVVVRHGLRSALIPVLTAVLSHIPHIIGGSVVVEQMFGWPGTGSLLFSAISGRDYPVIMGVTVMVALAVLGTNLLLDLLYGLVDPRVRYEER